MLKETKQKEAVQQHEVEQASKWFMMQSVNELIQ